MPFATLTGPAAVELCYEIDGNPDGPPVLLIAGLGVQLIDWDPGFTQPLLDAGYRVIRFDNRDAGLSTTFDGAPSDPGQVLNAALAGETPEVGYTMSDLAADAAGLLEALSIDSAHVIGVSLGGMIAQTLAIEHGHRVRSLTSIMSSTGSPDVGQPSEAALAALMAGNPTATRNAWVEQTLANAEVWASPGHFDPVRLTPAFERSWDRVGEARNAHTARQLIAIMLAVPRDELLASLAMPTLVMHGTADTLISVSGGERTAACVPGARYVPIEGLGHDMAPVFHAELTEPIVTHVDRAEALR